MHSPVKHMKLRHHHPVFYSQSCHDELCERFLSLWREASFYFVLVFPPTNLLFGSLAPLIQCCFHKQLFFRIKAQKTHQTFNS